MNRTYLIFRHEFLNTVKRTGFIIMTLALPVLGFLGIGVYQLIAVIVEPPAAEEKIIGYVDNLGEFDQYTRQGYLTLLRFDTPDEATQALVKGDIEEYFIVPPDYISTGVISRYTLEKQLETPPAITSAIKNFLTHNLLADKVPLDIVNLVEAPLALITTRLTETGAVASEQGGYGNIIIPGIFSFLLAFSIIFSSNYMLSGLVEEKENRLIEVLLSSVSARQLLTGKILALGSAGLIQVAVWLASLPLLLSLASSTFGGFFSTIQIPANFIVLGVAYFVLGYLLFVVLAAGIGAISTNTREGAQLVTILTLPLFIPIWFSSLLFIFPDSPIWVLLAIFPITAPVEVMLRLGVTDIPAWQLAVSIATLVVSIAGVLLMTIRVFRTYLLMYGKRPSFKEIIRLLKQA
jgi:ABC-2 type transport system permease protein